MAEPAGSYPVPDRADCKKERIVGEGRFAEVWLARNIKDGKYLAIKVFKSARNRNEELQVREMIRAEVNVLRIVRGGVSTAISQ